MKSEAPQYDQIKKGVVLLEYLLGLLTPGGQNSNVENATHESHSNTSALLSNMQLAALQSDRMHQSHQAQTISHRAE